MHDSCVCACNIFVITDEIRTSETIIKSALTSPPPTLFGILNSPFVDCLVPVQAKDTYEALLDSNPTYISSLAGPMRRKHKDDLLITKNVVRYELVSII